MKSHFSHLQSFNSACDGNSHAHMRLFVSNAGYNYVDLYEFVDKNNLHDFRSHKLCYFRIHNSNHQLICNQSWFCTTYSVEQLLFYIRPTKGLIEDNYHGRNTANRSVRWCVLSQIQFQWRQTLLENAR